MRQLIAIAAMVAAAGCTTVRQDDDSMLGGIFGEGLSGAKLDAAMGKAASYPFGSNQNPGRANMPQGQRAYLERLRCSDGNAPAFERAGNVGPGPYGTIVDLYKLRCLSGQPSEADVYMDMYHDHVEQRAVPGFTIKPR